MQNWQMFFLVFIGFYIIYQDLTKRIIPNYITLPLIVIGLFMNLYTREYYNIIYVFIIMLFGFVPFWLLGVFGGGDIKLMTGLGLIAGIPGFYYFLIYTVFWGGLLSIIYLIKRNDSWKSKFNRFKIAFWNSLIFLGSKIYISEPPEEEKNTVPYGVAIVLGYMTMIITGKGGWK